MVIHLGGEGRVLMIYVPVDNLRHPPQQILTMPLFGDK